MTRPLDPASPAARLLADARKRRFLGPFLGRTRRLAQAARELGVSPARLGYWVRRFRELGLLVPDGRGYRTPAEAFFVPFEASPGADLADWLASELKEAHRELLWAMGRALAEQGYRGLRVFRNPQGTVTSALARGPDDPGPLAPFGVAATLHLTPAEAEALKNRLQALWAAYADRMAPDEGRRPYRVYAFLTEVPDR